ncbi:MAG TPA: pyridoxamine 5'-phosphate oxidase [Actinomycetota bacterium]|jgi:pyridoxamine 5'-phosphate oxidase|nr:pyridoxamine 5'-phosphate oxidase [Actinomycetota bacterium]
MADEDLAVPPDPPETFDPSGAEPDPLARFQRWWDQAKAVALSPEVADSMFLATADREGRPSARMVILRGFDGNGFVFFTNYESPKARELIENPRAALVFYWADAHRQVRVTGPTQILSREESDSYFRQRPPGHRLAAWASPQSEVIPGRAALERRFEEARARFSDDIPLPPFWGGFRVEPEVIEFWQGREDRLHDRVRYTRQDEGWVTERLAP